MAVNGLVSNIDVPADKDSGKFTINYARYEAGSNKGIKESAEFDFVIGSDGANSRVAKVRSRSHDATLVRSYAPVYNGNLSHTEHLSSQCVSFPRASFSYMRRELDTHPPSSLFGRFYFQAMDAGEYNYAIAFQERIKISEEKMEFYEVCDGREDLHSNQGAQRSTDVSRTSRDMCTPVYMHMWWRCVDRLSHVATLRRRWRKCTWVTMSPPTSTDGCSPSTTTSAWAPELLLTGQPSRTTR